ncbi:NUDIX hydrolase [Catenulispora acidiphila DSM 44928]|uniref:NUDIX hydrolase n=1 Tax=Catenulispora acidiphila (strain DSM 44928 / JCM 14897 / NBRC 102108 / NRRL B-24433 / ID139908) TaxID=479433 RepID=C7PVC8_CATAD|nr:NUDIX domain-containing protein [Catenulispora acidiphila]ACU69284.1 NUDIX hydrolase [Catenulispora acidiphila DSM 44928]
MDDVEVVDRISGRVILLDPNGRALLFQGFDPQRPNQLWWITPGGGLEPGETPQQAAARELQEETSLDVQPQDLGEAVFRNYVEFFFDGRLLRQHNHFFTLRTEPFEISTAGFDALEQRTHLTHRWWTLEELRTTDETFFPEELPDLLS